MERAQTIVFEWSMSPAAMSASLRALIDEGRNSSLDDRSSLYAQREAAWAELEAEFRAGCDAIVAPAAPGPAPEGVEATGAPFLSRPWQLFGLPQVTLPVACDSVGLPLGIQVIGRRRADRAVLRLAHWLERQMGRRHDPQVALAYTQVNARA